MSMRARRTQRILNGLRKVTAGLRPFGESVWPGVRNDLFVAHESIYRFASPYARGANVLEHVRHQGRAGNRDDPRVLSE